MSSTDLSSLLGGVLSAYNVQVQERLDAAAEKAAKALVEKTKQTAPSDPHSRRRKHYRSSITYTKLAGRLGLSRFVWHAKGADGRLTHLLVHGHLARDGSRVRGNSFLHDACEEVFPQFLADAEEAVKT
jgi:hypothetical protein